MSHKPSQMKKDKEYRELLEEQLRLRDRVFSAQEKFRDALTELNLALDALSTSDKRVLQVYSQEELVDHDQAVTAEMIEDYQFPNNPTPKVIQGLSSTWISNKVRLPPPRSTGQVEPYITADDIAWCNGGFSSKTTRTMMRLLGEETPEFKK